MNDIFKGITNTIGEATAKLDSSTVVTDTISQYFTLPSGATAESINVYTAAYNGGDENWTNWATKTAYNGATVALDGNTVTVTKFDYAANFVSENAHEGSTTDTDFGKKLIIEIPVVVREGFWGGNNVPTNGSATIACGNITGSFPQPTVNVPLNIPDFAGNTLNVYCGNTAPETAALYTGITVPTGDNAWEAEFVTIGGYSVDPSAVSTTEDKTYTVSVTVSPSNEVVSTSVGAPASAVTKDATATVNVYTPTVTFPDSTVYYGDTPDYATQNTATVAWKHVDTLSTAVTMTGDEPTLSYTYSQSAGTLTADSDVTVTGVSNGLTDIKAYTKLVSDTEDSHDFTVYVATPNFEATDTTVYITNSTDLDERVTLDATTPWTIPTGAPTTIQGTAPTLVTKTFTYDVDGTAATLTDNTVSPETCTEYTVTSVTLSNSAGYALPAGEGITPVTATVHVLVPKIVCTDKTVYLGESTTLSDRWTKNTEIQWVDTNDGHTDNPKAKGIAPELAITAALTDTAKSAAANITNDSMKPKLTGNYDFALTVNVGTKDITDKCVISKAGATTDEHDFTVTVVPCALTVAKSGGDSRDSYIFTVSYTDPWTKGNVELKVAVRGDGSAKIADLPIGTYTVTEDGGWSWRYEATNPDAVTLSSENHEGTATVANEKTNGQWLSAESYAVNTWSADGSVSKGSSGWYTSAMSATSNPGTGK